MFYTHYLYIYIFRISGKARLSLTDDKYKVFQQIKNLYINSQSLYWLNEIIKFITLMYNPLF